MASSSTSVVDLNKNEQIAELQLSGGGTIETGNRSLTVTGTVTQSGGTIRVQSGGSLIVTTYSQSGGTLEILAGGAVTITNFTQAGTVTQSGGDLNVTTSMNKTGGSLSISAGTMDITPDLDLVGGSLTISGGTVTITADLDIYGGALTINGGTIAALRDVLLASGSLGVSGGAVNITRDLSVSGGTLTRSGSGALSITRNFNFTSAGGSVNLGTYTLTVPGEVNFTSGSLSNATIQSANFSSLTGMALTNSTLTKTGAGPANTSGGNNSGFGVTFRNESSSSWTFQNSVPDNFAGAVTFERAGSGSLNLIPMLGQNLNVSNNLTLNGEISFGTGYLRFLGPGSQQLSGSTTNLQNLEINKSGGSLTLTSPIVLNGSLNLAGGTIAYSGVGNLIMAPGSSTLIGNSESHVTGPFVYQVSPAGAASYNLTFPVGKAGIVRPVILTVSFSGAGTASFSAELMNSPATNLPFTIPQGSPLIAVSGLRYWQIDCTGPGCSQISSATVELEYRSPSEEGVSNTASLRIAKSQGGDWINIGGGGPSGSIMSTIPFTTFSAFTLATTTPQNALPVTLTHFLAKAEGDDVVLDWETATEQENDFFEVQHSRDGIQFQVIGLVDGAGDSHSPLRYQFRHEGPAAGLNYYRLRQVDFDGSFEYLPIASVEVEGAGGQFRFWPNPAGPALQVDGALEPVSVQIFDAVGRLARQQRLEPGQTIDLQGLAPGLYLLRLHSMAGRILAEQRLVKH